MFKNVPARLTDYLRSAASDFDRESFYYFAAAYLGLASSGAGHVPAGAAPADT